MSDITVDLSDGIATIQLNRPATLNALTPKGKEDFLYPEFVINAEC
jgi:enoyl-CoA hydratase/carnithine racemase